MTGFRVGDRVTFTANRHDNSYAHGWFALERFNGATGTVTAVGFVVVYVKWDTPLDTYHRSPKSDGALSAYPENLTLIKETTVTTFKPGDRVVYNNVRGGNSRHDGTVGTVVDDNQYAVCPQIKWDGPEWPEGPVEGPNRENVSLYTEPASPYATTIADLRAKAAAKRIEADEFDATATRLEKIK